MAKGPLEKDPSPLVVVGTHVVQMLLGKDLEGDLTLRSPLWYLDSCRTWTELTDTPLYRERRDSP